MDTIIDFELKILDYYNKNCKEKGLILLKSEKRMNTDSEINLYDYTFRYNEIEMHVTFADDDEDYDIRGRFRQVLRENNIYL